MSERESVIETEKDDERDRRSRVIVYMSLMLTRAVIESE